ncbi:MAG: hypothetical protein Q8O57_05285, partial [Kiritimatiellota bacterium]|nr:hypothetical protein [Kiritimatiellota bacterium]
DAVVIVVSEETGMISVSHDGRLIQNLDESHLRRFLSGLLLRARKADHRGARLKRYAYQVLLWVRQRRWRGEKRK